MNSKRPARRLKALNQLLSDSGEMTKTSHGVPILRVGQLVACFFGESDKFRLFAANYEKVADFPDTEDGRDELAAILRGQPQ